MFYAGQALLKAHGIEVTKHSAVASMLGRHFAKTRRLDPKFHRMFLNARRVRETADYGIFEEIIEPTANLTVEEGRASELLPPELQKKIVIAFLFSFAGGWGALLLTVYQVLSRS